MHLLTNNFIHSLPDKELDLVQSWIHQWGTSFSEAVFEAPCRIYKTENIEGFIGYLQVCQCAVVYGDPVCSKEEMVQLANSFHNFCQKQGLSVIYISASQSFAKWAIDNCCKSMIEIGEEVILDPFCNPCEGPSGRRLRYKINYAINNGLTVSEYINEDMDIEHAIQQVCDSWRKSRKGLQIHLGDVHLFKNRTGKRWFYVRDKDGHILGAALLSRMDLKQGWLLKYLVSIPNAPRGTSELLMNSILITLKGEQCRYVTYGMIINEKLGETQGLNAINRFFAMTLFKIAKWIFRLSERKTYWQKFLPDTEPRYLLFSSKHVGIREIYALAKAMKID